MTDSILDLIDGAIQANGDAMRWMPEAKRDEVTIFTARGHIAYGDLVIVDETHVFNAAMLARLPDHVHPMVAEWTNHD